MKIEFDFSFPAAQLNFYGRLCAFFTFVFSTMLFMFFMFSHMLFFAELGFYFILTVIVFNAILLAFILIRIIKHQESRRRLLVTAFTMLLNILPGSVYHIVADDILRSLAD